MEYSPKLSYTQRLLSSDDIPSLSHIWQWKSDESNEIKNEIKIPNYPYGVPLLPRKFVTYEWNVGRTNNQIYSFEAMLQYCVLYERTVIVPISTHRNHPIGFTSTDESAIWDFFKLTELCDFVFEYELATLSTINIPFKDNFDAMVKENGNMSLSSKEEGFIMNSEFDLKIDGTLTDLMKLKPFIGKDVSYFSKDLEPVLLSGDEWKDMYLSKNEPNFNLLRFLWFREFSLSDQPYTAESKILGSNDPKYTCHVSNGVRDKISHEKLDKCRLIHFTMGRHNHFKLDDFPIFDVLMFMRPSTPYRISAQQTIIEHFERPENYRVGVHRRAMKEGGMFSICLLYVA